VALATAHGIPHRHLSAAETADLAPPLRLAADMLVHTYYEPNAGLLRAEQCIAAQLQLAGAHGAHLHAGERVLSIEDTGGQVTVRTDKSTYQASACITATGAWMADFLPPEHSAGLQVQRQVMYWFRAEAPSRFAPEYFPWVIWIGDTLDDFFAVWPTQPGGIPGVKLMTESYPGGVHAGALNREVAAEEINEMYERYVARRLRGVSRDLVHAAVCAYTVTPDENFVIDRHPAQERVWVASACSGHGFKHAAAVGEALAALALDETPPCDVSAFSLGRAALG
ncbi:MAG: FAD-dependent oxidoreductase, partial [Chloroflexota bacterium]